MPTMQGNNNEKCFQFETEMVRASAHLYQQWRKKRTHFMLLKVKQE